MQPIRRRNVPVFHRRCIAGRLCTYHGKGITCFNQALADNPLAGTKGTLGLGASQIIADANNIADTVSNLVDKACGNGLCDTTTKDTKTFTHGIKCETGLVNTDGTPTLTVCDKHSTCTQIMTVDGRFSNENQKNYMKEALKTAMKQGTSNSVDGDAKSTRPLNSQLSFAGVQINDAKGANLATVRYTLENTLHFQVSI